MKKKTCWQWPSVRPAQVPLMAIRLSPWPYGVAASWPGLKPRPLTLARSACGTASDAVDAGPAGVAVGADPAGVAVGADPAGVAVGAGTELVGDGSAAGAAVGLLAGGVVDAGVDAGTTVAAGCAALPAG